MPPEEGSGPFQGVEALGTYCKGEQWGRKYFLRCGLTVPLSHRPTEVYLTAPAEWASVLEGDTPDTAGPPARPDPLSR